MDGQTLCVVFDCPYVEQINTQSLLNTVTNNLSSEINHLYLLVNTPGGSVNHGIFIFNYLKALPIRVTTHNIGQVDSIGNVIFIAGTDRFATPNSTFLFHGIASGQWAGLSVNKAKEAVSQLENDENRMTKILRENTQFTADDLRSFYDEGKSITPQKALEKGVIQEIKTVEINASAKMVVAPTQMPKI